ncbi:MAG: tRNA-dihydrouridine synthase [Peptostreptococcaceae bacterium]|nr:tRNA-dihydrouridine synthase [Peptostreptococcaceae bacterium]
MTLSTEFMGLKLKNPIIVAAGPWSRNGEMIKKAFEAGAGAVVTETIVNEVNSDIRPRIAFDGRGVQNIRLYSDILIEEWQNEIKIAKSRGGVVIASVCAQTPSEIKYIATKMEKMGADAIELGLASPMGEGIEVLASNTEKVYELTKAVVDSVNLPVMVKLSQNVSNIAKIARAVEKAGANGISAIDTVRCIIGVDVKNRRPYLPTYGGYSGGPIKPLGLASVATIAQSVKLPVCGIGGIETGENVLEYMMLGASTVQIGTFLMINGFEHIDKIKRELLEYMNINDIKNLSEIRGVALNKLKAFDEISVEPKTARIKKEECYENECKKCVKCCVYGAIEMKEDKIMIHKEICRGCGLCCDICPSNRIELIWD